MSSPRTTSAATAPAARLRGWLQARDLAVFRSVADRHWPGADPLLPRLSRSANHGLLWFGAAAGIAALGSSARSRRAALRGVASLAVASAAINTVGKGAVRRERPIADLVPVVRQLKRQPITTSFPSGHAASAAAFATGVALESKGWGAVVAPVAVAVAASRVYTGVHYPSDVLAGAALGIGAAFALRGVVPTRGQLPAPGRPPGEAPALPAGKDLVVVVNRESGTATATASLVREALPAAEVVEVPPEELSAALEKAAGRGRALGVCGGDGTVNLAASVAATHGMPLAVFPGGTLNHFAYDLGIETVHDTAAALTAGDAIKVDLGRFRPGPGGVDGADGYFLNAFSLGVYPELVRTREHWSPRIGGWPAGVLAAFHVLRGRQPLEAELQGRRRPLWLLFVGNGLFQRVGPAPGRRHNLADGLLDVRVVHGGRTPALRLMAAAVAGPLTRSPAHAAVRRRRVRIGGLAPGTPYAYDGEVAHSGTELTIDKLPEALTVYCPLPA
ncbi:MULTISPECIES: bifunctional phosphatase PAP2/diacylglycerol kinase family protein [Streptomyces]|uniref:bifunctional phosphatase PAP2/diacylglycerol kinase family protein n=1 Tax=Streptomyces TaxID=1883 RepID=UPI000939A62A|nr:MULTISPECIES: phosphatase PAP2 family protein [unclassified Streptomyces]OKJ05909.1 phosphoesterase [Streptomyces sp. TSRI0261]QNQ32865.1 phosphatase PAP2 family protein [Streptomyces sp. CB00271]